MVVFRELPRFVLEQTHRLQLAAVAVARAVAVGARPSGLQPGLRDQRLLRSLMLQRKPTALARMRWNPFSFIAFGHRFREDLS